MQTTITPIHYYDNDKITDYKYESDEQSEQVLVMHSKSKAQLVDLLTNHEVVNNQEREFDSSIGHLRGENTTLEKELKRFMRDEVDNYQTFKHTINGIETPENTKIENIYAVEGFQPVVPLALMGIPTNMITQHRSREQMVLNIMISPSVPGYITNDEIQRIGGTIFNALIKIQEQGIKFNLVLLPKALQSIGNRDTIVASYVVIKSANEDLIPEEVVYGLANSSTPRGLGWSITEIIMNQDKYDIRDWGYGCPMQSRTSASRVIQDVLAMNEDMHNVTLLCYSDFTSYSGKQQEKAIADKFNGVMQELSELEQAKQEGTLDQLLQGIAGQGSGGSGEQRNILNVHY